MAALGRAYWEKGAERRSSLSRAEIEALYGKAFPDCSFVERGNFPSWGMSAVDTALDYALLDGVVRGGKVCIPHISLDMVNDAYARVPAGEAKRIERKVAAGRKLDRKEKSFLRDLPLSDRIPLTIAYVANACLFLRRFPAAALILTVVSGREVHASLLLLTLHKRRLVLEVYDTNGAVSGKRTNAALIEEHISRIDDLCPRVDGVEPLSYIGEAIQTLLGEFSFSHSPGKRSVSMRGYGICRALSLWILRRYSFSSAPSMETLDRTLADEVRSNPDARVAIQERVFRFMRGMAVWRVKGFPRAVKGQLYHTLGVVAEGMRVEVSCTGGVEITWPDEYQ